MNYPAEMELDDCQRWYAEEGWIEPYYREWIESGSDLSFPEWMEMHENSF